MFCAFFKTPLADEAQLAIFYGDDRRRPRLPINDGELACDLPTRAREWPRSALRPRRSYDDFEKASFEPIATVAGIACGKKRVTGTEVTRFGARSCADSRSGRRDNMAVEIDLGIPVPRILKCIASIH